MPTCEKFHLPRTLRNVNTVQIDNLLDKYYMDVNSYNIYSRLNRLNFTLFIVQIRTSKQHSCPCACQECIPWSGGVYPFIFKLGIRWRLVVTFTHRPLTHDKICLDTHRIRALVGTNTCLGRFGEEKNCLSIAANRTTILQLSYP
jgi:hypothetical protein